MADNKIEKNIGHRQQQLEESVANLQHEILQLSQKFSPSKRKLPAYCLKYKS